MSSPSSPLLTLDVERRPAEVWIGRVGIVVAALAPWVVLPLSLLESLVVSIALSALISVGLIEQGWLGASSRRVVRLTWLADGRWMAQRRDGRSLECELCLNSRVQAGCVWLRLRALDAPRGAFSLLLIQSRPSNEALRRLIVRLRLDVPRSGAASALAR